MQVNIKDELHIHKDRATVFKALIDTEKYHLWRPGVSDVSITPEDAIQVGTEIVTTYEQEGETMSVLERVRKLDFPNELVMHFIAPEINDVVSYSFEAPSEQETIIKLKTTKKNLGFMYWTILLFNKKVIRQLTRASLEEFKAYVENKS